jgi:hypothetical protein
MKAFWAREFKDLHDHMDRLHEQSYAGFRFIKYLLAAILATCLIMVAFFAVSYYLPKNEETTPTPTARFTTTTRFSVSSTPTPEVPLRTPYPIARWLEERRFSKDSDENQ